MAAEPSARGGRQFQCGVEAATELRSRVAESGGVVAVLPERAGVGPAKVSGVSGAESASGQLGGGECRGKTTGPGIEPAAGGAHASNGDEPGDRGSRKRGSAASR